MKIKLVESNFGSDMNTIYKDVIRRDVTKAIKDAWNETKIDGYDIDIRQYGSNGEIDGVKIVVNDSDGLPIEYYWTVSIPGLEVKQYSDDSTNPDPEVMKTTEELKEYIIKDFKALQETIDMMD